MAKLLGSEYEKLSLLSQNGQFLGIIKIALVKAVREKLTWTVKSGQYQSEDQKVHQQMYAKVTLNDLDNQARRWANVLASWDEYINTVDCEENPDGSLVFFNFNENGALDYTIRTSLWGVLSNL
ncbi:MAG: hypothetical protein GYA48_15155 [Chloroflexi bacterium]|nr:hypothetical protein [Chloroflexota bacterium]